MSRENSILFFIIFLASFSIFFKLTDFVLVGAQLENIRGTTANVTIKGVLDNIVVEEYPVNFSFLNGNAPGFGNYTKQNLPYLNISLGPLTNVRWNISINGTNMVNENGNIITVENIFFNTTNHPDALSLSNIHQELEYEIEPHDFRLIYFYLTIPVGAANGTYYGDIWVYVWSNEASEDSNNKTWSGLSNTTVTVKIAIGIDWSLKPIDFGILNPGVIGAKALDNYGWPTNITVDRNTNVPVDLYINGTDLVDESGVPSIGSKNITYYNYTHNQYDLIPLLSDSVTHTLNNTRPASSTHGDFENWGAIPNSTDVFSYWNISLAIPGLKGSYYGNVTARIFVAGEIE